MTRREAILEAALDAFERKGVLAATIDDIRSASRASVGSIYHHFGDKAGIVDALYAWLLGDWQRGFLQALGGKGAEAGARAGVVHNVSWAIEHPAGMRFLLRVTPPRAAVADLNRVFFAEVRAWLARHPEIRELDPTMGEAIWLGPSNEYCRHWLAGRAPKPDRRRRELLADTAWRSLCLTPTKT